MQDCSVEIAAWFIYDNIIIGFGGSAHDPDPPSIKWA
jgi:hypothetical protein